MHVNAALAVWDRGSIHPVHPPSPGPSPDPMVPACCLILVLGSSSVVEDEAWEAKERCVAGSQELLSLVQGVCLHVPSNSPRRSSAEEEGITEFIFIIYHLE